MLNLSDVSTLSRWKKNPIQIITTWHSLLLISQTR